jgi:hypothetical protein
MWVSVRANVRVAGAARRSAREALQVNRICFVIPRNVNVLLFVILRGVFNGWSKVGRRAGQRACGKCSKKVSTGSFARKPITGCICNGGLMLLVKFKALGSNGREAGPLGVAVTSSSKCSTFLLDR